MSAAVNGPQLGVRAQKTAQTRRQMIGAAYTLFTERGYDATKMVDIAERAGVAHQTLYFTFRNKQQLLHEVFVAAVMGPSGLPPEAQPWFGALRAATDGRAAFAAIVEGAVEIFERVRPLVVAVRATAENGATDVWRRQQDMRRHAYENLLAMATARTPLRAGLDPSRAVDTMLVVLGPDVFQLHTADNHWSSSEYAAWATDSLCRLLLDE